MANQYPLEPGDTLPPGDAGSGSSGGGGSGAAGTTIISGTYNKEDGDSLLFVSVWASLRATDDLRGSGYLIVNGRVEQEQLINQIFDNRPSAAAGPMTFAFALFNLPAGPIQIAFAVRNTDPNGPLTVRARTIVRIEEIKTPAL